MAWLLVAIIVWLLLAVLVAFVIGRAVHRADVGEGLETNPGGTGRPPPTSVVAPPPPSAASSPAGTAEPGKDDRDLPLRPPTPHDSPTVPALPVARPPVTGRTRPRREPGDGSTSRPSG